MFITSCTRYIATVFSCIYAPESLGMLWRQAPHAAEGRDVNSESYARSRKQIVSLKRRSVTKRVRYTGVLSNTPSKTSPIINDLLIRLSRSCSPAVDIRARISTAGVPCCSRVGSRMNSLPCGLNFRASMSTFSCRWSSLYVVQHEVHDNNVIGIICYVKCSNVTKLIVHIGVLFQPFLYGFDPYFRNIDARQVAFT